MVNERERELLDKGEKKKKIRGGEKLEQEH